MSAAGGRPVAPLTRRAAAGYSSSYRDRPAGVWSAPGRVNLIGEHTDYNDGFVLPFALPLRIAVAAGPQSRDDGRVWTVHSGQTGQVVRFTAADLVPGRVTGWPAYLAGVVWALESAGHQVPGARLSIAADLPSGAGLSSSAALECAVLAALADLGRLDIPTADRPALAQRAENGYVGVPCGIMDQSAAVRCLVGHALLLDCRTLAVEQVPFDPAATGLAVLVLDTRAPRRLVAGEYAARRADCEAAAGTLGVAALRDIPPDELGPALSRLDGPVLRRRVRHVVTENQRVLDVAALLRTGDVAAIGGPLTASHVSLRDDFEVTVPELDLAVEAALAAGALGARMTGGGFGGCVLALVDAAAAGTVTAAVTAAFAGRGFAPPAGFVATPATGAYRDR